MKEICCIGHITTDRIITPASTTIMPGGTAYYFAHGMQHLNNGKGFKLITCVTEDQMNAVTELREKGIDVEVIPTETPVFFENKYGENSNNRTQRLLSKAERFHIKDLREVNADIIHLGSLLADDFSLELCKFLSRRSILSVDAQGYLRDVEGENIVSIDWKDKAEYLKYIAILKVNEFEILSLTGYSDPSKAALQLSEMGVKESVITLGSYGSIIYDRKHIYEVPAFPTDNIVDATGCGDTFSTGYLYQRALGAEIGDAALFAAAMSTIKLQHSGPFNGTIEDIQKLIQQSNLKVKKYSL